MSMSSAICIFPQLTPLIADKYAERICLPPWSPDIFCNSSKNAFPQITGFERSPFISGSVIRVSGFGNKLCDSMSRSINSAVTNGISAKPIKAESYCLGKFSIATVTELA